ncbi:hypothetical protein [Paucibacter soli]|uniref:hypothetical protein n=1 Tax=Paucibacter soli TaxID=3133433 RepID=UPI00309944B5
MASSLEKSLTNEGWLPPSKENERPDFNRRVLTQAAAAREAEKQAQATREMLLEAARESARSSRPAPQEEQINWLKLSAWSCVAVVVLVPILVTTARLMQTNEVLTKEGQSGAVMICKNGTTSAADDSSIWSWLFGGSAFRCRDWETLEGRKQREKDQSEANYLARERAKRTAENSEED